MACAASERNSHPRRGRGSVFENLLTWFPTRTAVEGSVKRVCLERESGPENVSAAWVLEPLLGGRGPRRIHYRNLIPAPNWTPSQILENKVLSLTTGSQRSGLPCSPRCCQIQRRARLKHKAHSPASQEARALLAARPHPLALAAPSSAFGGRTRERNGRHKSPSLLPPLLLFPQS